jgi:hypothetical protein
MVFLWFLDYKIKQFDVKKNKKIADEHIKETFVGASNETVCSKTEIQCILNQKRNFRQV